MKILAGAGFLGAAYLNWRYVEAVTRFQFGERAAKRLANSWFGNKIGGTIFLGVAGSLLVISGIVRVLR